MTDKPMLIDCTASKCGEEYVAWSSSGTSDKQPENLPVQKAYCYFCPNRPNPQHIRR